MNQYDPYSMTTDEKRRQLMEMYNLQFNPQPMQPPKPPRMAALPVGATMATPPAIAFARGPSQLPRQQQAQEMPMGGGMGQLLREEVEQPIDKVFPYKLSELPDTGKVNDMILSAFKPSYGDSAQGNYNAYVESLKRYERIRPSLEKISSFYTSLIGSSRSAIEREFKKPFEEVFYMYLKQMTEPPDDVSKSFFDWYVRNRPAAPVAPVKMRKEDIISSTIPTLPPRGTDALPSTRMAPIRPPYKESMK